MPLARSSLLLKKAELKNKIESVSKCKLYINKENIRVESISKNTYDEYVCKNILVAFGHGFNVNDACLLSKEEYYYIYINLEDYTSNEKRIQQIKGRVIGNQGKAKKHIEEFTSAKLSVYGNTIGIIGKLEGLTEAEVAVKALIVGETHKHAYIKMEACHKKNKELEIVL
ncbi:MAG: hypothetical protein QXD11_01330 [Candidatus Micrarchaeaceae archaeon]